MHIIVIGAGLLGTTTAYFLARDGHEVTVVERGAGVARETSFANGGIVHAGYAAPWNSPAVAGQLLRWAGRTDAPMVLRARALPGLLRWGWQFLCNSRRSRFERALRVNARLAAYSLEQLRDLRQREHLQYQATTVGSLGIFPDTGSLEAADRETSLLGEMGIRHQTLDRAGLLRLEPSLSEAITPIAGAVHYPDDESGDALQFTQGLADRARARGVRFCFETTVTELVRENGRVIGVATDRGNCRGDGCVLAAGSYSPLLARAQGLRLPIYPVKGFSITVTLRDTARAPARPIIDSGRKTVMALLGNRLRIAGFAEFNGYNTAVDEGRTRALLETARTLFPALDTDMDTSDVAPWAGLRPITSDGRPLLGASGVAGLWLATGTGHLGWTMAAGAGRIVADAVGGATPAIDPGEISTSCH